MSAPDRAAYAERQAHLLEALLRGEDYPAGFVAGQAGAAGRSLRRKRARAVAHAWPALALDLGAAFDARFDAFARDADAPRSSDALEDGLAFVRCLGRDARFDDDARVEVLLARAQLRRRGLFVSVAWLRRPYPRLLLVARVPHVGAIHRSFAWRPARAGPRFSGWRRRRAARRRAAEA
ncbi:MAG: hypothetical protein QOJ35_845 [Solirubrobacteraceae bacterium]|nr:hypothetical protein [Solirubrobacteraceae bacterium]